jgi:hypothetical protein
MTFCAKRWRQNAAQSKFQRRRRQERSFVFQHTCIAQMLQNKLSMHEKLRLLEIAHHKCIPRDNFYQALFPSMWYSRKIRHA